jgi:nicotinamidase/pyrazinamidase
LIVTRPPLLFWDVDTQVDFMHPDGKLYVPGAENVIPNIQRLNTSARQNGVLIISSTDAHQPTDPEFADYPPHCLAGTPGQEKVEGTVLPRHFVIPNRRVDIPQDLMSYDQVIVQKQATDVFTNPNMEALLQRLEQREIVLYGVVTEICVEKAAHGLIRRGYRVNVVEDAIRHLDAAKGRATIDYVLQHGGKTLTTSEAIHTVVSQ